MKRKFLLMLLTLIVCFNGIAQTGVNPLTGNTTNINNNNDIASDYGPRRVVSGSKFHRGIDFRRNRDAVGYAIEGGNLIQIKGFGTQQPNSVAYIDIGSWRYMHMRQTNGQETNSNGNTFSAPTDWKIISDGDENKNNDLLVLTTTINGVQTINVYSANPKGIYDDGLYPIGEASYQIDSYVPVGSPIFRAGRYDVTAPHLHLQSTDAGTNPLTVVSRPDASANNITLTNFFKLAYNNALSVYNDANTIYGNVLLENEYNSDIDRDFNELEISIRSNGTNDFVRFFNWRYSGNNRIDTNKEGESTTPANNVRVTPQGATTAITVQQARDDVREGMYPLSGTLLSHELLKKQWSTQILKGTNPYEPVYPDNRYEIRMVARDLTNHETINNHSKILDNYLPFIKKVEVFKENGGKEEIVYSREWIWNGNSLVLGDIASSPCQDNEDIKVRITSSEPLAQINLTLNGENLGTKQLSGSVDPSHKVWLFNVAKTNTQSGNNMLQISGTDLAGNNLQINPNILSRRNPDGTRPSNLTTGIDNSHVFSLVSSVNIVPDFSTIYIDPFNSKRLQFIDLSTPSNKINNWQWNSGSEVFSTERNPVFTFNDFGAKNIRLTVREGIGTAGFSKERTVLVEEMAKPIPDFAVEIRPKGSGLSVLFHDATKGIVGSWKWIISKNSGLKSATIEEVVYTGQNPQNIELEQGIYYDVRLETSNEAGVQTITKPKCIFYEEGITPSVSIITTKENALDFNFLITAVQFEGFLNYEIDYGDGTIISYPNESFMLNVTHKYPMGGIYTMKVTAQGKDLYTGSICSATCSYKANPSYEDLNLTMNSTPSGNYLTWETITFSGVNSNRNEEKQIYYWWTVFKGTEINQHSVPIKAVYGYSNVGVPIDNFKYTFTEPGSYVINLNVWNDRLKSGNTRQIISVGESPIPIKVLFGLPDEKYKNGICENTSVLFHGGVANDYAQNAEAFPTTLRWTLFRNGIKVDGYPITDKAGENGYTDGFSMNRSKMIAFGAAGKYKIRLEGWCNKKMNDADAKPENNNLLGYYDVRELDIIVSSNLSAIQISNSPKSLPCTENSFSFNVSNPGKKTMPWRVEIDPKNISWLSISSGNSGVNSGAVSVKCNENTGAWPRTGLIRIIAEGAQDSPVEMTIVQAGAAGETEQLLSDLMGKDGDQFGHSVAVSGEYAVIGAPYSDYNGKSNCGSFFLARKINGEWKVLSKCNGTTANGNLGYAVDICPDYIIVGEPGAKSASIMQYDSNGVSWGPSADLISVKRLTNASAEKFGTSVAIYGDNCVIGSEQSDINGSNYGTICFYSRSEDEKLTGEIGLIVKNRWSLVKTYHGVSANDFFGCSMDMDGDYAVIGARGGRYVSIYQRNLGGSNNWGLENQIKKSENENFGRAVAINGNRIYVSDYRYVPKVYKGYVYGYQKDPNSIWTHVNTFDRSIYYSYNNEFACAIAASNTYLAMGAKTDKSDFGASGLAWYKSHGPINALKVPNIDWDRIKNKAVSQLYPLSANDKFGFDVDVDLFNLIVGAPGENNNRGLVYINNIQKMPTLCGSSLSFQNFTKYSGKYSDIKAVAITIGGGGYEAIYKSGASITYVGESILLRPGVHIETGAFVNFRAETVCSNIKKAPQPEEEPVLNPVDYMNDSEIDIADEGGIFLLKLIDIEERVFKFRLTEKESLLTDVFIFDDKNEQVFCSLQSNAIEFVLDFNPYPIGQYTIRVQRGGKTFERLLLIY